MESEHRFEDSKLENEAFLFADYLIDVKPPQDMVERYIDANRKLGTDIVTSFDARIMEFALAYPWSVPFLDSAAGFLRPETVLRKKIYIMAAVLEASPRYTNYFFPESLPTLKLFFNLIANALTAGAKVIIGIPIYFYARGKNND